MYKLPLASSARPNGPDSCAAVAAAPSPVYPAVLLPATVLMMPAVVTLRTTLFPQSAMYTLPAASDAMQAISLISAAVAGPPSPR